MSGSATKGAAAPTASGRSAKKARSAVELIGLARSTAAALERTDLAERLQAVERAVVDDRARVLVIGEFKAGKSELVNALLGGRVLPTDAHRATTVPTVCTYDDTPSVVLARVVDGEADAETVDPGSLAEHVTEKGNPENRAGWAHADVRLPRSLLAHGLRLVDTPGAGGLASPTSVSTMAELPGADAVVLVSDAGRELTAPELALVRTAAAVGATVVVAMSRTDIHPRWRRIAELDRGHLSAAGLDGVHLVPTSARLALLAARPEDGAEPDASLAEESGLPDLTRILVDRVAAGRAERRVRTVADEVIVCTEQLAGALRAERDALADPRRAQMIADEQERSRERVAALRGRAARWQQTLNDGIADLNSDIDHDLRDRLRTVLTDAETALDDTDPAKTWEQFSPWLHQQVAAAVATNAVWAEERTRWLSETVARHFAEDGEGVLPEVLVGHDVDGSAVVADPVGMLAQPDHEKVGVAGQFLIGMRGSYGGILMVGLITTVAGMALLNPFSIGAGLLLGSKTLVDERKRALQRRRAEAKQAVRRHIDEIIFQAGKNSRDMLRGVQRGLRDHFTRTSDELDRSLSLTAQAAKAVEADSASRKKRLAEVEARLARVEELLTRARELRGRQEGAAPATRMVRT
ncbi:dynamin family protein [Actinomycetospora sp. OC33-EN08]|uniref:Dynamin family protein n=1 Tax=Actinomycetospora aurantiaca TaxID=3129233 RepID=A0ABU8MJ70_9PSEU